MISRSTRIVAVALLALLIGCGIGPRAENADLARKPTGSQIRVQTRDVDFRDAELLVSQDSALLILTEAGTLVSVYHDQVWTITLPGKPPIVLRGRAPAPRQAAVLKAMSRFPQGLTATQLDQLIAHHGNRDIEVIR